MPPAIEVDYTLTRSEYIQAVRRYYDRGPNFRLDTAFFLAAIAIGAVMLPTDTGYCLRWCCVGVSIALLIRALFATYVVPFLMYLSVRSRLQSECRVGFQENGIHVETKYLKSHLQWSFYHTWLADDVFYILNFRTFQMQF